MNTTHYENEHTLREVEQALENEPLRARQNKEVKTKTKLPALLRIAGVILLLSAAAAFLVQNWEHMDHIQRYLVYLGFTGILAGAGFWAGVRFRDDKAARTFLAVALAIVPTHFSQLGALLFSRFGTPLPYYPHWFWLEAPSAALALATTVIGIIVLLPITYAAFTALARPVSRELTIGYTAACATLLLPTRNPDLIGILAFLLTYGIVVLDLRTTRGATVMRTKEGYFIRIMMFLPLVLLVARTLGIYQLSTVFASLMLAAMALILFDMAPEYVEKPQTAKFLQAISTVPAALSWSLAAGELIGAFHLQALAALVTPLPIAALLVYMSCYTMGYAHGYRKAAGLIAAFAILNHLFSTSGHAGIAVFIISIILCSVVSIAVASYGLLTDDRLIFWPGVAAFLAGVFFTLRVAPFQLNGYAGWGILAALGICTIFGATYIERRYVDLMERTRHLRERLRN